MERLISAYRKDDWADAKGFTVQLGVILEKYPADVVEYVTHPLTGIQRKLRFPPSLAEIVEACDACVMALQLERWEREREECRELERRERQRLNDLRQVALCHLWMRADPPEPARVAEFSDEIQQQALRMSVQDAVELFPSAASKFTKPIEECRPLIGGIVG